jgi:nickel-dependent lactate racemase
MYSVPFSRGHLHFRLPSGFRGHLVESRTLPPIEDVPAEVRKWLDAPVASPPLRELAGPGDKVCIVFTDITRSSPDYLLVPPVLEQLEAAGVKREDITLLCGIGMHRPSTHEEKIAKLGEDVVRNYRVIDNEPQNPAALVDLGTTPSGIPLTVHRECYEADLLIATGIVEPHQYAGYSGGRKTLAVGAAGEAMIAYSHGPQIVDHPGTRLGQIDGNPFHEAITEAARRANLRFIVNVVIDDNKNVVAVRAGATEEAFMELVAIARSIFEVPIPQQYDVAVGGIGFPKDANLYQASRAASYLFFAPTQVVRDGGYIILPAGCEEGCGEGVGEQRFFDTMRNASCCQQILDDAREFGYAPGEQRAFVMAKVLEKNKVIVVGSSDPDMIRDGKMIPAATMDEAFAIVQADLGQTADTLIVPHALLTLPIVQTSR